MDVGFIGLGDQGAPMAEAIADGGFRLHVWARRPEVVAPYVARGATAHGDPAALAAAVDQLALCVIGEADVREILFERGALAAMRPGSTIVVHSTISPEGCAALEREAAAHGVRFLDAPVSGGHDGAVKRTLLIMVGGDDATFAEAKPVFETYGANIHHLGGVGAGQVAKILNNLLVGVNMAGAEFVLELGRTLGVDRARLRAMILTGTGQSFSLDALDRIINQGSVPSMLPIVDKDLGLAAALAERNADARKVAQPLIDLARDGWQHIAERMAESS